VERALLEATGRTEFRGMPNTSPLCPARVGAARCLDSGHQVCIILNTALSLTIHVLSRRPTGWHGESGAADWGGHVTVDFCSSNGHVTRHHVYRSDNAYMMRRIFVKRGRIERYNNYCKKGKRAHGTS
jgi:hypothetical protein